MNQVPSKKPQPEPQVRNLMMVTTYGTPLFKGEKSVLAKLRRRFRRGRGSASS